MLHVLKFPSTISYSTNTSISKALFLREDKIIVVVKGVHNKYYLPSFISNVSHVLLPKKVGRHIQETLNFSTESFYFFSMLDIVKLWRVH